MAENENEADPVRGQGLTPLHSKQAGKIELGNQFEKPSFTRRFQIALEYRQNQLSQSFLRTYYYEIERGLAFNFIPILLGIGIALYFAAPAEPLAPALALICLVLTLLVRRSVGRGVVYATASALLCVLIGMLAAKVSVIQSDTPQITQQITGKVSGTIVAVDENRRGSPRYRLVPESIEGLTKTELPRYIRLSAAGRGEPFPPGTKIEGIARLQPVLGPVYPGSYDFSFFARFDGIGGSGFFMGKPESALVQNSELAFADRFQVAINSIRLKIKTRIETALPGKTGKIATALVIGDKSGIPPAAQDALRATGLAHILAISGLHMALVALTTLWVLRFSFAINSYWTLHYPIKKWAATGAFLLATGYLMISGFGVATQRAWIMISVMLVAVLMDRRAITLRNVAISAIIIVLIEPVSLLSPGFQMSFAAVIALVSAYEAINKKRRERLAEKPFVERGWLGKSIYSFGAFTGGLFTTSLVAGLATSFIAAWHFHQVAPLGLLANLLAMPIVTLIVMPAVLFSILLIPFGLDPLSLTLVSYGINGILEIAYWVNGLMPVAITGSQKLSAFVMFLFGFSILCLFKSRIRLFGLCLFLIIPFFTPTTPVPDVLIAESGRSVAVKMSDGTLATLIPKRENFVTSIWGKAYAGGKIPFSGLSKEQCNREVCIYTLPSGPILHLVYDPDLLRNACDKADILIAPRLKWVNCKTRVPQLVLKREDFESRGSHEVYVSSVQDTKNEKADPEVGSAHFSIHIKTAFQSPNRPWHRKTITYQD